MLGDTISDPIGFKPTSDKSLTFVAKVVEGEGSTKIVARINTQEQLKVCATGTQN